MKYVIGIDLAHNREANYSNAGSVKYLMGGPRPLTVPANNSNAGSVKYFMVTAIAHNRARQPQ